MVVIDAPNEESLRYALVKAVMIWRTKKKAKEW